ncbi:MAG: hypothetical protein HC815_29455 [Richelia sp. RM1_1_1]|nr:hypothetical protein [Richelia sp. RM1_1_1]
MSLIKLDSGVELTIMNSQINFIKQIITILMGLSITSSVQTFIEKYFLKTDNNLNYLIFTLLVLNIIRFFYANWMYLDSNISKSENRKYLVNFILVISQSLIFSFLSFVDYDNFFQVFSLLLIIDIIGCISYEKSNINIFSIFNFSQIFNFLKNRNNRNNRNNLNNQHSLEKYWILNNLLTVIVLLFSFWRIEPEPLGNQLCLIFSIINTITGFKLSWKFYYSKQQ